MLATWPSQLFVSKGVRINLQLHVANTYPTWLFSIFTKWNNDTEFFGHGTQLRAEIGPMVQYPGYYRVEKMMAISGSFSD